MSPSPHVPRPGREDGEWKLRGLEVLYRMSDARRVPFPAFVNFVKAASDQTSNPDGDLRNAFEAHTSASLRRVDERLTSFGERRLEGMSSAGLLTAVNVTAKQLPAIVRLPLRNPKLLAVEDPSQRVPHRPAFLE